MLQEQCIVGILKGLENCHHYMSSQNCITFFILWNIKEDFEKCLSGFVVHTMEIQCNGVWLPTFFKISSFVVCERKNVYGLEPHEDD